MFDYLFIYLFILRNISVRLGRLSKLQLYSNFFQPQKSCFFMDVLRLYLVVQPGRRVILYVLELKEHLDMGMADNI